MEQYACVFYTLNTERKDSSQSVLELKSQLHFAPPAKRHNPKKVHNHLVDVLIIGKLNRLYQLKD